VREETKDKKHKKRKKKKLRRKENLEGPNKLGMKEKN
jgi:hypothetical protein